MSRVLLVDDSPHAQRMGERILADEGYEVVTVSNADSALVRMEDVDPDVVLADTVMPGRTGFEICQYLKMSPRHRHVRVILTAGVLEPLDEAHTARVEADGVLKKPFEASALLSAVKPLAEAAAKDRANLDAAKPASTAAVAAPAPAVPFIAVVDSEQVRAAVTVALDAAMEAMVDEISNRVLAALKRTGKAAPGAAEAAPPSLPELAATPPIAPAAQSEPPKPAVPPAQATRIEPVRRVSPLRLRTGSILGIEINRPEPSPQEPAGAPPSSSESQ